MDFEIKEGENTLDFGIDFGITNRMEYQDLSMVFKITGRNALSFEQTIKQTLMIFIYLIQCFKFSTLFAEA
ncbi:hypothetical protein RhiirA5_440163 [Rhizophagus irregularis]|uniref:Uncharacterized protein n=1 Tax=Rhizophagus irregularis TaxID=588596 RepID=A0A2N0NH20_9GLOM|nr:hypothetical protein RhiirA5_440163 [Rhizophagus irregularis]